VTRARQRLRRPPTRRSVARAVGTDPDSVRTIGAGKSKLQREGTEVDEPGVVRKVGIDQAGRVGRNPFIRSFSESPGRARQERRGHRRSRGS
jgi:hypothetical protein